MSIAKYQEHLSEKFFLRKNLLNPPHNLFKVIWPWLFIMYRLNNSFLKILISEHFVKWIFFEKIALFDIAVDHFFGFVAGLAHDGEGV